MTPTVLIVEDNPITSATLARELGACGFSTHVADSAEIAFEKLEKGLTCDLVVLDFHLPGELGSQFYQRLKLNPKYKEIPIVPFSSQIGSGTRLADEIMSGYATALQIGPEERARPNMVSKGISDGVSAIPGSLYGQIRKALKSKRIAIPETFDRQMREAMEREKT